MKKYRDEVESQSSKLNLGLRRTAMIDCDRYRLPQGRFVKYGPDFKVFYQNHTYNFKYYFPGNVLYGWRFQ